MYVTVEEIKNIGFLNLSLEEKIQIRNRHAPGGNPENNSKIKKL